MFCWHCGKRLTEEAESCPACGMIVVRPESPTGEVESAEERVHSLLTQANLLRVRREWQAAILRCTEALKTSPNNASAHSLLGDICRDEGRLRDAMEWYKLALTLDPSRRLDREKLDALIDETYGCQGENAGAGEVSSRGQQKAIEKIYSSLRIGMMALVALILVTLAAYLLNYQYLPDTPAEIVVTQPMHRGQKAAISVTNTPTTAKTTLPLIPESQLPQTGDGAQQKDTSIATQKSLAEREQDLMSALSWQMQRSDPRLSLLRVSLDPRSNAAEIAFALPQGESIAQTKQQILEWSLYLGKTAITQEPALAGVRFRAHIQLDVAEGRRYEISFIGESSVKTLREADVKTLAGIRNQKVFSGVWWHPLFADTQP